MNLSLNSNLFLPHKTHKDANKYIEADPCCLLSAMDHHCEDGFSRILWCKGRANNTFVGGDMSEENDPHTSSRASDEETVPSDHGDEKKRRCTT
jgi:hypothetical protein